MFWLEVYQLLAEARKFLKVSSLALVDSLLADLCICIVFRPGWSYLPNSEPLILVGLPICQYLGLLVENERLSCSPYSVGLLTAKLVFSHSLIWLANLTCFSALVLDMEVSCSVALFIKLKWLLDGRYEYNPHKPVCAELTKSGL